MNKKFLILLLSSPVLFFWISVECSAESDSQKSGVQMAIPQSDLNLKVKEPVYSPFNSAHLDLMVSSWMPTNFNTTSQVGQPGSFDRSSFPALRAAYLSSPFSLLKPMGLSVLVSSGFLKMTRSDPKINLGKQSAYLVPFQVGFQSAPRALAWRGLQPSAEVFAMPTVMLTSDSSLESGKTVVGWPFGFSVGATCSTAWLFHPYQNNFQENPIALHFAFTMTTGDVAKSSLFGMGIEGGLRLAI